MLSELSEHDQATLRHIEEQLAQDDPRLNRLLAQFGGRGKFRMPSGTALTASVCIVVLLVLVPLVITFAR